MTWLIPVMAEVKVSVDRNPVQVNESFQLVFSLDQSPDREPDFSILQQHFLILSNNKSNSISIINGEYNRSVKWNLQLMAKQVGEYMIPAIRFDDERSKPFKLTVKPSSLASAPQDQLVLEMLADRSETYVQSQVLLTLRLLSATNISAYQFGKVSVENLDAVIEPLGDAREYQTRIADKTYLVLEKQYALFPQQSGRLAVTPVLAEVRLPSRSSFDPFQTGGKIRRLRSPEVFVEVKPIPADFSGAHWLPADKLELRENWQGALDNPVAGEPITRNLTLYAEGLTAAQLPVLDLAQIDGIKQYPDQPALNDKISSQGIRATRQQKIALIPATAGSFRIPEIRLPWWNRQTGQMEIATIPARDLLVGAAPNQAPSDDAVVASPVAEAAPQPAVVVNRFWLWMSLVLACGWALSAAYWWFKSHRVRASIRMAPESPSLGAARKALRKACLDNDAAAARRQLLAWGRSLPGLEGIDNLHRLGQYFGDELSAAIEQLNRHLYATSRESWQGLELWSLCQRLEQDFSRKQDPGDGLAPLSPLS